MVKAVRKLSAFVLLAATLVFFSFAAEAREVTIINNSGKDIYELYISSSESQQWGQDLLGRYYIPHGVTYQVRIGNYRQFDLMVVDNRGNRTDWYEIPGNVVRFFVYPDNYARWEWDGASTQQRPPQRQTPPGRT